MSVLPILSAVYFVEAHQSALDIIFQENVATGVLRADEHSFAPIDSD